jgi:hypothetical protein
MQFAVKLHFKISGAHFIAFTQQKSMLRLNGKEQQNPVY